ncbi:conserved domain protein [delta proteobacterium NaphS2]|nr:conserved domain protein [delta proteobacterium NaphS2]
MVQALGAAIATEALVAGFSGLYKTAALVIAVSSILAITAFYLDGRRRDD